MKAKKVIILSIVMVLLLGCGLGCGTANALWGKDLGEFRNIPFGTKYKKVDDLIHEDLAVQTVEKPHGVIAYGIDYDQTRPIQTIVGVDLYGYTTDIVLYYKREPKKAYENKKEIEEGINDSILYSGQYFIRSGSQNELYNFFYEELKEKYGDDIPYEQITEDYIKVQMSQDAKNAYWQSGGTDIILKIDDNYTRPLLNKTLQGVSIIYSSREIQNQISEEDQKLKEEAAESGYSGL